MRTSRFSTLIVAAAAVAPLYAVAQPGAPVPPSDDDETVAVPPKGSAATGSGSAATGSGSAATGSGSAATGSASTPTGPGTGSAAGSGSGSASAAGSASDGQTGSGAGSGSAMAPGSPLTADGSAAPAPKPGESSWTLARLFGTSRTAIHGWTDVFYGRYDQSLDELSAGTRAPLNQNRFQVRRAYLRLESDWKYAGYVAEANFFADGNVARPTTFDVHAQLPGADGAPAVVQAKAGLFPVPFTYQNLKQASYDIFFAERAMFVDAFVPGRQDLGAAVSGHIWQVSWMLAAQNGQPLGSSQFAYQDPNREKDYSGRVEVGGNLVAGVHAATGMSFIKGTGFSPGTAPTKDTFVWRDINEDGRVQLAELISIPGAPGRPSENFGRWGLAGDLRVWRDIPRLGELRIDAELALGKNLDRAVAPADPVLLGRDQRGLGFYASVTQYITEHAQVGFRYDTYNPNIDDLEMFDGRTVLTRRRFQNFTVGVSGRLKLSAAARARLHLEYAAQKNSLGRDTSGVPAQLDNNTMRLRLEVVF